LPDNAWVDHYEVALNLHTVGARAEGILGNTETMEFYCKQVISQADRPLEDKFGVYNTWIDSLLNRVLFDEAGALGLEILGKFKCRFPKNSVLVVLSIVTSVIRVKATMKSRDVSKLSLMNDSKKVERNRILDKIGTVFYMAKDMRFPLVVFKSLNWTMKDGCNEYSSVAFAGVGVILTGALNDLPGGSKYGEQALVLLERSNSQITAARTMFLVYGAIFAFTKPLRSLLKPILRGYDVGLQSG
jgi:predicted ATPase